MQCTSNSKVYFIRSCEGPDGVKVQHYSFFNLVIRWGCELRPYTGRFTSRIETVPFEQKAVFRVQIRSGRTQKISHPGIPKPDRPVRSKSLYTCILIVRPCILIVVYVFLLLSMYSYCSSMYSYRCLVYLLLSMYSQTWLP